MRLRKILSITEAKLISPDAGEPLTGAPLRESPDPPELDYEVQTGFSADLMSDVLCYEGARGVLITGLINPQIVRTAEMADIAVILLVRGKTPMPETSKLAREVGIPIIGTQLTMFETCGRLYAAGLPAARRHQS